jgi:hypothetical protein
MSELRQTEAIERQLSAYLTANPEASDTAEGIGRWWLPVELADAEALATVLERLVERGILERESGPDGRLRYRKAKRADESCVREYSTNCGISQRPILRYIEFAV